MRKLFKLALIISASTTLASCATIENPEDCDIRCGFGKNAEFSAENENLRKDLANREADNARISEQLDAAKVTEASLQEREANLRALLDVQNSRLSSLEKKLNAAVARNQITEAQRNKVHLKIVSLNNSIRQLQSKPKMTEQDLNNVTTLVQSQIVPFFQTVEVVNIFETLG